jgi:hypothetical protein
MMNPKDVEEARRAAEMWRLNDERNKRLAEEQSLAAKSKQQHTDDK